MKSTVLSALITLFLFFPMIQPVTVSAKEKTIVDVISEMGEDGSYILLGDYSINRIGTIVINSGAEKPEPGTKKDLAPGALAEAQLGDRDSAGQWKAFQLILYTGEAKAKMVESLRGTEKDSIVKTLDSIKLAEPQERVIEKPGSPQREDSVKFKDGVYTN